MYTPKKLKWNNLTEFRDFLLRETSEKVMVFEGWRLVTETTEYTIFDGSLKINPKQKKLAEPKLETLGNRPKVPKKKKEPVIKQKSKKEILEEMRARGKKVLDKKKEIRGESKSTEGRSDGTTADQERVGTHGRSDHVKSDRQKASKVRATKVPKKVSKRKKSPK